MVLLAYAIEDSTDIFRIQISETKTGAVVTALKGQCYVISFKTVTVTRILHHHHHSFMELGHLLTRSGLTHPEVSLTVYHDFFCQFGNTVIRVVV